MLIRVNGRDMTREFGNASYVFLNQNLSVRWENRTLAASFLQTCESIFIIIVLSSLNTGQQLNRIKVLKVLTGVHFIYTTILK